MGQVACRPMAQRQGSWRDTVDRPDLLGDEILQPPKIAVMNSALFKMQDSVVKIFGLRSRMTACTRQYMSYLFQWLRQGEALAGRAHPALSAFTRSFPSEVAIHLTKGRLSRSLTSRLNSCSSRVSRSPSGSR